MERSAVRGDVRDKIRGGVRNKVRGGAATFATTFATAFVTAFCYKSVPGLTVLVSDHIFFVLNNNHLF